jgi:hypothetical protein
VKEGSLNLRLFQALPIGASWLAQFAHEMGICTRERKKWLLTPKAEFHGREGFNKNLAMRVHRVTKGTLGLKSFMSIAPPKGTFPV